MNFEEIDGLSDREVRLFPTAHITSIREAELRATAALLAMIRAVSEFGRVVTKLAGAPAGRVSCYTELAFENRDGTGDVKSLRPDGVIRCVRGKRSWSALVEVKVGDNHLDQKQFDEYHRLARERGFDAVVTVSNQAATTDGLPPLTVDRRRLRGVPVIHLSWDRVLSEARLLGEHKTVEDLDQRWMLDEWIRYVADPASRIVEPPQLGNHWGDIMRAARSGDIAPAAKHVPDTVRKWDGYLRKLALRLRAKLGVDVQVRVARAEKKDPSVRYKRMEREVLAEGRLSGTLVIPDTVGDIDVDLLLLPRSVRFGTVAKAPTEGRQKTRVNWMVRQLRGTSAPDGAKITVEWGQKVSSSASIDAVIGDPACLFRDAHGRAVAADLMPRRFLLEWTRPLAKSRGKSTAPILESITANFESYYGQLIAHLSPYSPPAPRLPDRNEKAAKPAGDSGPENLAQAGVPTESAETASARPSPSSDDGGVLEGT